MYVCRFHHSLGTGAIKKKRNDCTTSNCITLTTKREMQKRSLFTHEQWLCRRARRGEGKTYRLDLLRRGCQAVQFMRQGCVRAQRGEKERDHFKKSPTRTLDLRAPAGRSTNTGQVGRFFRWWCKQIRLPPRPALPACQKPSQQQETRPALGWWLCPQRRSPSCTMRCAP